MLHIRWWHASAIKMKRLLETVGVRADIVKLVDDVVSTCAICRMWQRPGRSPVTHTRLSLDFNEAVQLDLLFFENETILHLIDESTRWTCASYNPSRTPKDILGCITRVWIRIFGAPRV